MKKEYTFHSKEEKLHLVKRYLAGESPVKLHEETGISDGNIRKWKRQYLAGGEAALANKKKPGNSFLMYTRKKKLSREEELEYQVELLKRELLKKDAEVARLKKSSNWKGAVQKESDTATICSNTGTSWESFHHRIMPIA